MVVVEIISGLIDMNFNYEPHMYAKGKRRVIEVGKHRERKEVTGVLANGSAAPVRVLRVSEDDDSNISEPPTEVLEVPGEGGGGVGGDRGGEAALLGSGATTTSSANERTSLKKDSSGIPGGSESGAMVDSSSGSNRTTSDEEDSSSKKSSDGGSHPVVVET